MKKRLAAILLALAMIATYMPTMAFAAENEEVVVAPVEDAIEQPVVEQPAPEEPVVEDPIAEGPVVEEPVVEEPVDETGTDEEVEHYKPIDDKCKPVDPGCPDFKTTVFFMNGNNVYDKVKPQKGWGWFKSFLEVPADPSKDGYTFDCWYYCEGKHEKKLDTFKWMGKTYAAYNGKFDKLYAKWCANNYTVAFDANGGEGTMTSQKMTYDKLAQLNLNQFTNEGFAFAGWSTTPDGEVVYKDGQWVKNLTKEKDGTVTLYAKWAKVYPVHYNANIPEGLENYVTISFMPEDGYSALDGTYTVSETFPLMTLKDSKLPIYRGAFLGWSTTPDGEVEYDPGDVMSITGETTLYAQWANLFYTVDYKNIDFDGVDASGIQWYHRFYFPGLGMPLGLPTVTRTGYTFLGWFDAPEGGNQVKYIGFCDRGDKVLYAHWEANDCTIIFKDGFGGIVSKKVQKYDEKTIVPKNPTKKGYKFLGWSPAVSETVKGDAEYVALWEAELPVIGVDTGDTNNMVPFAAAGILALAGIATILVRRKRTN